MRLGDLRRQLKRRNPRRSTGPKTLEGKASVARNALRHGLAVPIAMDVQWGGPVERLAALIAGEKPDASRLEVARRIAEAQIEILRVRRLRQQVFDTARTSRPMEEELPADEDPSSARSVFENRRAAKALAVLELLCRPTDSGAMQSSAAGLDGRMREFAAFDRYERRAISRRKFAIRELEDDFSAR
jgi:hypothetical protein